MGASPRPFSLDPRPRALTPNEIEALLAGERTLPGRTPRQVSYHRRRLGLGRRAPAPQPAAIDVANRMEAMLTCPHLWMKQSIISLPSPHTSDKHTFASIQARVCPYCGSAETRMWTTTGYVTQWCGPKLPIVQGG